MRFRQRIDDSIRRITCRSQADGPAPEGMVPNLLHGHTAPIGGGWLKGSLHIPTCTRDRQSGIRFQPIWSGCARRNAGDAMQMGCMEIRTFHTWRMIAGRGAFQVRMEGKDTTIRLLEPLQPEGIRTCISPHRTVTPCPLCQTHRGIVVPPAAAVPRGTQTWHHCGCLPSPSLRRRPVLTDTSIPRHLPSTTRREGGRTPCVHSFHITPLRAVETGGTRLP